MDAKAIRVMTIHKAKGLEFKCTHIPFLAYKVPKFDGHQWFVSQPLPGIDENIMPVSYTHLDVYKRQQYRTW